jgi:signal transduction histidine kinase
MGIYARALHSALVYRIGQSPLEVLQAWGEVPRRRLLFHAGTTVAADVALLQWFRRQPDAIEDPRVALAETAWSGIRLALFVRSLPKQTYWHRPWTPFSSDLHTSSMLWACALGDGAGVAVAAVLGLGCFVTAALVNGERFPFTATLRRRLVVDTLWPVTAATVAGMTARALGRAAARLDEERTAAAGLAEDLARAEARITETERLQAWAQESAVAELVQLERSVSARFGAGKAEPLLATITGALAEVRRGPSALMAAGEAGLMRAVGERAGRLGIRIETDARIDSPLTQPEAEFLGIVLDVALSNISRHAPGAVARFTLEASPESIRVQIVDTGPGVHHQFKPHPGHALDAVAHYAESLGGSLEVAPTTAGGTRVTVRLPRHP